MKNRYPFLLVMTFLILSFSLSAQDQLSFASKTKGFSAGAHAAYISHESDAVHLEPESAPGYGIILQYGINHNISVALSYQRYSIKPKSTNSLLKKYPLTEYDVIGKYIFGSSTSKLRPNLLAGFNFTNTEEGFYYELFEHPQEGILTNVGTTEEFYGTTFLVGGGLSYYFSPNISGDLSVLMHTGQFTKVYLTTNYTTTEKFEFEGDIFNLNGHLGLRYHF